MVLIRTPVVSCHDINHHNYLNHSLCATDGNHNTLLYIVRTFVGQRHIQNSPLTSLVAFINQNLLKFNNY